MALNTYKATVSLEFDLSPVKTHQTMVSAARWPPAARRALESAFEEFPGSRPRSVVVVLEREGGEDVDEATDTADVATVPAE